MRGSKGRVVLAAVSLVTVASGAACMRRSAAPQARQEGTPAPLATPAGAADQSRALGYGAAQMPAAAAVPPAQGGTASLASMTAALKLIRTAQVSIEVASYEKAAQAIARLAEGHGGYVADTQAARGERDRRHGTITLKVPASRFGTALAELKAVGTVESEQVSTQDVTKAYSDLETRLKVKRETADRLREILKARTAKLAEILEAERELARVTEEIEHMEGERRFYDHQVALSTITAQVHEPHAVVRPGLFTPVSEALRESLGVLVASFAALIFVAAVLAPWLGLALVAWRATRAIRARRRPITIAS
jgi:hypothetical protein